MREGLGSAVHQEILVCLVQLAAGWTPNTAEGKFFTPCSKTREEVLGVGGLYTLAKGVYTEIQAGETNGCKRKTFTHK